MDRSIDIFFFFFSLSFFNSIIYDFTWKGKDRVKRSSIIGDIEHGSLKAPHFESIITKNIVLLKNYQ